MAKSRLYAASGVGYYWIEDADTRTLEAFELVEGRWVMIGSYAEDAVARIAPFAEIELPVGRLFLPAAVR